jgi:hypothetical protein
VVAYAYTGKLGIAPRGGVYRPSLFELAEILTLADYLMIPELTKKLTDILAVSIPTRGVDEPQSLLNLIASVVIHGKGSGVTHMRHWGSVLSAMLFKYCRSPLPLDPIPKSLSPDQIIIAEEFERVWEKVQKMIPKLAKKVTHWTELSGKLGMNSRPNKHLPMFRRSEIGDGGYPNRPPPLNICTLKRDLGVLLVPNRYYAGDDDGERCNNN